MYTAISRKVVGKKMCTRPSGKVIWDMINTPFLTTVAVEPTFVAFLYHMQTNVPGLPCHSFKFLWRTVHLKTTHNTFRDWRLYFSEIAVKTTRDYTALALSSGWTRTQTIFSVNLSKVEPYSHRLGGRYDTKRLYKVKFLWKKKVILLGSTVFW